MAFHILPLLLLLQTALSDPLSRAQTPDDMRDQCSKLLKINGNYFLLDETRNVSGVPADMNVHWRTGDLYFTLISEEMKMSLQVIKKRSGIQKTIRLAGVGQSTAIDNVNDAIYLATDNGVYKLNEDGSVKLYAGLGEDVMYVTLTADGSVMYIATYPQNRVHKITKNGKKLETFSAIPNGHGLTVDPRGNIYFIATKTPYVLQAGQSMAVKIKGLPNDKIIGIYISKSDEVFAMDEDSHWYHVHGETASSSYVGSFGVSDVNTFALDEADNVFIGVNGAVMKFQLYETDPCIRYRA